MDPGWFLKKLQGDCNHTLAWDKVYKAVGDQKGGGEEEGVRGRESGRKCCNRGQYEKTDVFLSTKACKLCVFVHLFVCFSDEGSDTSLRR